MLGWWVSLAFDPLAELRYEVLLLCHDMPCYVVMLWYGVVWYASLCYAAQNDATAHRHGERSNSHWHILLLLLGQLWSLAVAVQSSPMFYGCVAARFRLRLSVAGPVQPLSAGPPATPLSKMGFSLAGVHRK